MPDKGDVRQVRASNPGDSQVRVYAVQPREGAEPDEIVDGFLEAMTSDDLGFATARKYLTKQAARTWKPEERITVLSTAPDRGQPDHTDDRDLQDITYSIAGKQVATVDARHAYQPISPANYAQSIHLVQEPAQDGQGKEWRIDRLPAGLVLSESDFQRNYRSVNKYYFASGEDWVVADPVYIRNRQDPVSRMDPVAQTVKALLEGPTNWLKPVVDSRFPTGTALKEGVTTLTADDQSTLKVPLNDKAAHVGREQCRRMASQLLFTLGDLPSVRVEQVELQRANGSQLCVVSKAQAEEFAAVRQSGRAENAFFVDEHGTLMMLPTGDKEVGSPSATLGPFGKSALPLQSVAVSRDESRAAGVSHDGRQLHVASIISDHDPRPAKVISTGAKPQDRLSAPSWDGRGDLWVADRNPLNPRLMMVPHGEGPAIQVRTPWLEEGSRIKALRVSADGVRVALLLQQGDRTTLQIGRVDRQTAGGQPVVSVVAPQHAAPRMEAVTAVSWAGPSRLVVVGKEAEGVEQVRYVQTDGSTSATSVLPGLNGVTEVSAPHDDRAPVVADSVNDGIVRLAPGANWQPMVKTGSSPVYPG
ncbi:MULTISPECIES: LpqB family beta-propeller domain-containing protein [Streptomyces]|uniref:LpqB family beta-propeller domain-containing protein n=1 Tax=Streptomyces solicathayae TaxID=3081768 RepID=A0ABZ0M4Q4_9ACTN|nr:LpqB family beta-propeller domain-containing protein [Streptomyces sp. HUAS YS2]WOX26727.1 LpqB family beta-propeller domain-containing protein [Streptomyces sp. HUAS YS2]